MIVMIDMGLGNLDSVRRTFARTTPGRLDTEFVYVAIEEGKLDVSDRPFLKRVLSDQWEQLGWPFQQFLAENSLSLHLWLAARKK